MWFLAGTLKFGVRCNTKSSFASSAITGIACIPEEPVPITATDLFSSSWAKRGSDIDGKAGGDESGYSVSLSDYGTIVAIGADEGDVNGSNSGLVSVYRNLNNKWKKILYW